MATLRPKTSSLPSPAIDGTTVIGPAISVKGRIEGKEQLHIQGRVDGMIRVSEALVVEPGGIVVAEISAKDVVISGTVVGNVAASNCVTLNPGAKLVGDIRAPRLVLADGAAFRGNVQMSGEPAREVERARTTASRPVASPPVRHGAPRVTPGRATARRPTPSAVPRVEAATPAKPTTSGSREEDDVTAVIRHQALTPKGADGAVKANRRVPTRTTQPMVLRAQPKQQPVTEAAANPVTTDSRTEGPARRARTEAVHPRIPPRGKRKLARR